MTTDNTTDNLPTNASISEDSIFYKGHGQAPEPAPQASEEPEKPKEEPVSSTTKMLQAVAERNQAAAKDKRLAALEYEQLRLSRTRDRAIEISKGEPLSQKQWNDIQRHEFAFYCTPVAKELRQAHKRILGVQYYG